MSSPLLWISLIAPVVDWVAVARSWRKLEYLAKPAAMLALLAWLIFAIGLQGQLVWFALGLFFSLIGDVLLMLPRERFLAGLVAFLLAQLSYIFGFNPTLPPISLSSLAITLVVALVARQIYLRLVDGLTGEASSLKFPVLIYSIVISGMVLSALLTLLRPKWFIETALLCSLGAVLFFSSDTLLAWNRFISPIRHGSLKIIVLYHVGQIALILGAALQYSTGY